MEIETNDSYPEFFEIANEGFYEHHLRALMGFVGAKSIDDLCAVFPEGVDEVYHLEQFEDEVKLYHTYAKDLTVSAFFFGNIDLRLIKFKDKELPVWTEQGEGTPILVFGSKSTFLSVGIGFCGE